MSISGPDKQANCNKASLSESGDRENKRNDENNISDQSIVIYRSQPSSYAAGKPETNQNSRAGHLYLFLNK